MYILAGWKVKLLFFVYRCLSYREELEKKKNLTTSGSFFIPKEKKTAFEVFSSHLIFNSNDSTSQRNRDKMLSAT